jgi:hypothetical protein
MGMYYGLVNTTKKHNIISYWKGSPPSPRVVKFAINFFGWNRGDMIYSSCYCDDATWEYL